MKRAIIVAAAGLLVGGAYAAAVLQVAPEAEFGPVSIARIALPGFVTALVMTAYAAWEAHNARQAKGVTEQLNAQLVRKEIEIGRLSTVDELTGLQTRREFDDTVRLEFERKKRHGRELSLLLLEIDDITELGEHVGALSKGYLLSEVSAILARLLRANDVGCRYTVDSLGMLLPETGRAQALIVADKIRAAIAEHNFLGQLQREVLNLTVSQGIATCDATMSSHHDLMHAAEQTIAEARGAGFNQVKVYEPAAADNFVTDRQRMAG